MAVYVAVTLEGEVVGTIALGIQGEEGHLRGMAVSPSCQGSRIAQRLLGAVESDLIAAGCMRVTLDTTAPLQRAIRFYKRNGFIHSGRVTDFFGMTLYEYVKQLNRVV
jgi:ribosomal protein S18 acetylase RimI-like enzyme